MPKKPYSEFTEADWARQRSLKQYRSLSPEAWEATKARLVSGQQAALSSDSLEDSLEPKDRPAFRQEVKRILDLVVRLGGDREIMRPAAEKAAYYSRIIDGALKKATGGEANQRNLKDLLVGYAGFLDMLGITPEKLRLGGRKSDESLSEAVARSREAARKVRSNATALRAEEEKVLGDRA